MVNKLELLVSLLFEKDLRLRRVHTLDMDGYSMVGSNDFNNFLVIENFYS